MVTPSFGFTKKAGRQTTSTLEDPEEIWDAGEKRIRQLATHNIYPIEGSSDFLAREKPPTCPLDGKQLIPAGTPDIAVEGVFYNRWVCPCGTVYRVPLNEQQLSKN